MTSAFVKWRLCAVAIVTLLAGCGLQPYEDSGGGSTDAIISFESDYLEYTGFAIGTVNPSMPTCDGLRRAGSINKAPKLFERESRALTRRVATGAPVLVAAKYFIDRGTVVQACGPVARIFTPEPGAKYVVKMRAVQKVCTLTIVQITNDSDLRPVRSAAGPVCPRLTI